MYPGGPPYAPFPVPPPPYPPTQGEVMLRQELLKKRFFSCLREMGVRPHWNWDRLEPRIW